MACCLLSKVAADWRPDIEVPRGDASASRAWPWHPALERRTL